MKVSYRAIVGVEERRVDLEGRSRGQKATIPRPGGKHFTWYFCFPTVGGLWLYLVRFDFFWGLLCKSELLHEGFRLWVVAAEVAVDHGFILCAAL